MNELAEPDVFMDGVVTRSTVSARSTGSVMVPQVMRSAGEVLATTPFGELDSGTYSRRERYTTAEPRGSTCETAHVPFDRQPAANLCPETHRNTVLVTVFA
jgi:hypothetical protein